MPYFKTSQEWLDQSTLLIEARPATTRVTTRYSIKPVKPRSPAPDSDAPQPSTTTTPAPASDKPPRAVLVLKTYDPASGVTLKYKTTKAAEVGRLVSAALGRLGKAMAGIPVVPEESMPDAPGGAAAAAVDGGGDAAGTATPTEMQAQAQSQQAGGGGGGGKKKKKGRK